MSKGMFFSSDFKIDTLNNIEYYKKKPISIRAVQINQPFRVETMEGEQTGKDGDYLLESVRGELYCCDKEIFEETYIRLKEAN